MKSKETTYIILATLILLTVFALFQFYPKPQNVNLEGPVSSSYQSQPESTFANEQVERAITDYLVREKQLSWKTRTDSHSFCTIENLKPEKDLFPLYIWAVCGEYVIEDNKLVNISGSSLPVTINYPNELSFYDPRKFTHEVPRDGSYYTTDVKELFPPDVQVKIFAHEVEHILERAEAHARKNIEDWNEIKKTAAACEIESVMQTHNFEVTALLKDGTIISAKEPTIDDIFDVIQQHSDTCEEVMMATE